MVKIPYSKLKLTKKEDIKTVDFNEDIKIEVKQYLPVEEKLKLIANVLSNAADDNNFSNPVKEEVFTTLEIMYNYTNLTFTEKQKEDPAKLYDLLETNGVTDLVFSAMNELEYNNLLNAIEATSTAIYKYKNSALGIMDAVVSDYSNLNLDATAIQEKLADPENMALLKGVMDKLG